MQGFIRPRCEAAWDLSGGEEEVALALLLKEAVEKLSPQGAGSYAAVASEAEAEELRGMATDEIQALEAMSDGRDPNRGICAPYASQRSCWTVLQSHAIPTLPPLHPVDSIPTPSTPSTPSTTSQPLPNPIPTPSQPHPSPIPAPPQPHLRIRR